MKKVILFVVLFSFFSIISYSEIFYVSPIGNDDTGKGTKISQWRTIHKAVSTIKAGDTVLVEDGEYPGDIKITLKGTKEKPISIKAVAKKAVIKPEGRDTVFIDHSEYFIFDGFNIFDSNRAGIRISLSKYVTVRNCTCGNNGAWGIFTDFSDYFLIENNECYGSKKQHGIYVSNSGDYPTVRGNCIHDNSCCGLHVNGDPECGGDGVISFALIENNIIYGNGRKGGSAMNCDHVQDSVIRNNLVYNNLAGGIVVFTDFSEGGGEKCASMRSKIYNNTVYFEPSKGRWALTLRNHAINCVVLNNILFGGRYGALSVSPDSLEGLKSDYNVIHTHKDQTLIGDNDENWLYTLSEWHSKGLDVHSKLMDPKFIDISKADFHLLSDSPAIDSGINPEKMGEKLTEDIEGRKRPSGKTFDIGAYEKN